MSQKRKHVKEHPLGVAALQVGEFQYFTGRGKLSSSCTIEHPDPQERETVTDSSKFINKRFLDACL
jgi:hypothetical protein